MMIVVVVVCMLRDTTLICGLVAMHLLFVCLFVVLVLFVVGWFVLLFVCRVRCVVRRRVVFS